jgi:hypothetical protein
LKVVKAQLKTIVEAAQFEFRFAFSEHEHQSAEALMHANAEQAHAILELWFKHKIQYGNQLHVNAWPLIQSIFEHIDFQAIAPALSWVRGTDYYISLEQQYQKAKLALTQDAKPIPELPQTSNVIPGMAAGIHHSNMVELRRLNQMRRQSDAFQLLIDVPFELVYADSAWLAAWAWRKVASLIGTTVSGFDPIVDLWDCQEDLHSVKERKKVTGPWFGKSRFLFHSRPSSLKALSRCAWFQTAPTGELQTWDLNWQLSGSPRPLDSAIQTILKNWRVPYTFCKLEKSWCYTVAAKHQAKSAILTAVLNLSEQAEAIEPTIHFQVTARSRCAPIEFSEAFQKILSDKLIAVHIQGIHLGP